MLVMIPKMQMIMKSRRGRGWLIAVSLLFGLLNASGQWLYHMDHLPVSLIAGLEFGLQALIGAVLFFVTALVLLALLPLVYRSAKGGGKLFWPAFGIILLGWLPWIVSYYPCSADWDVYSPVMQYLGQMERTNGFPWFYSTVVGSLYSLGQALGDINLGLFLHILIRAPIMAAIYAYLVQKMQKCGIRKGILWAVILFYALVPVWGAYAKHGFKDTIHTALFCWYITWTIESVEKIRKGEDVREAFAFYAASSLVASLFRNNCIYIVIPVTVLILIAFFRQSAYRKQRLGLIALCLSGILVYGGYQVFTAKVEHVGSAGMGSALSVPLQQTARTARDDGDQITEAEREVIARVLDYDRLAEKYNPILSDPVKDMFHGGENGKEYLLTWAGMGLKHPRAYLEAAIAQGYGYYAFTPDQPEHAGNWNCGMTIFDWVEDPRFTDEETGHYVTGTEGVRKVLDDWAKVWHKLPVLGTLDDPPLYTWFIVCIGVLLIWRKQRIRLIPVFACLLTVLFCCASPVNDCFRYFAPVAASAPACLLLVRDEQA